jgi:hypothetical protein
MNITEATHEEKADVLILISRAMSEVAHQQKQLVAGLSPVWELKTLAKAKNLLNNRL